MAKQHNYHKIIPRHVRNMYIKSKKIENYYEAQTTFENAVH